jgi:hypothetical protein
MSRERHQRERQPEQHDLNMSPTVRARSGARLRSISRCTKVDAASCAHNMRAPERLEAGRPRKAFVGLVAPVEALQRPARRDRRRSDPFKSRTSGRVFSRERHQQQRAGQEREGEIDRGRSAAAPASDGDRLA